MAWRWIDAFSGTNIKIKFENCVWESNYITQNEGGGAVNIRDGATLLLPAVYLKTIMLTIQIIVKAMAVQLTYNGQTILMN